MAALNQYRFLLIVHQPFLRRSHTAVESYQATVRFGVRGNSRQPGAAMTDSTGEPLAKAVPIAPQPFPPEKEPPGGASFASLSDIRRIRGSIGYMWQKKELELQNMPL